MLRTKTVVFLIFVIAYIGIFALIYGSQQMLPKPSEIDTRLLQKPVQKLVKKKAYKLELDNKVFDVKPVGSIKLWGLVVSKEENFLTKVFSRANNFVDLCLIWGDNLKTDRYLGNKYHSKNGRCYTQIDSHNLQYFDRRAFSNNHLILANEEVKQEAKKIQKGDQVFIEGKLIDYKSKEMKKWLKTSIIRDDFGDNACEIILVEKIKPIKKISRSNLINYFFMV